MRIKLRCFRIFFILISFVLLFGNLSLKPCTVAVISGKVTPDGRSLLWKNRDTSHPNNKVIFVQGQRYSFVGVVNSEDRAANSVWQGINSKGFAIINSASNDLRPKGGIVTDNGRVMRQALETCRNVKDFETLLQETNGKRRVAANYGVIDAFGNACFFETSSSSYVKFDANDPETAPDGYILRTNFAFSSQRKNLGGGYIRFERISRLFQAASSKQDLNLLFILKKACRDLVNEKLRSDPLSLDPEPGNEFPLFIRTNDTINRISTISVSVFHGAPNPEKSYLATMWVMLGQPVCSVALPVWVHGESVPDVLGGPETAPMHDLSQKLISYLYHDQRANMKQYMNLSRFLNYKDQGFLPIIHSIEDRVMAEVNQKLEEWSKDKPGQKELKAAMRQTANSAYRALKDSFADILEKSPSSY
ncbi:MAG: hypothetical protein GF421_06555 [Candidatus Aminicenantes bacterium]|nr:hypothetical protein [Candidatus Aminicenantes bacterium]